MSTTWAIATDVTSWHNSQLSRPFTTALHPTPLFSSWENKGLNGRNDCPKVSLSASNRHSPARPHYAHYYPVWLFLPGSSLQGPPTWVHKNHISPTSWSTDLTFQVQLHLPTLTHLVTITPVSCILCDMRQVYHWIYVSRELIKTAKPINSLRNI